MSGRHDRAAGVQSLSLSGSADYGADHWLPWQSDYAPTTTTTGYVPIALVGDASATPHELATASDPGRPDGRITLPRISSPDAGGMGYAYWIGDEGVKARANLHDSRHASGTKLHPVRGMLTASGRTGINALAGFESLTPDPILGSLLGHSDLGLAAVAAKGYSDAAPTGLPATSLRHRRHRHDLSFWSQGLLVDSFWGGLKVDLSQAFEMGDAEFMASEFGEGPGGATLHFWQMNRTTRADPPIMEFTRSIKIWMPIWVPQDLSDNPVTPYRYDVAALYTHNWHDPDDSTRQYISLRGPTWLLLRDFHRLYKQVAWSGADDVTAPKVPTLRARTFWPNVVQNERMQPGVGGTYHYSHIFNRMDIPNPAGSTDVRRDPFVNDLNGGAFQSSSYALSAAASRNGSLGWGCPSIKPVRTAATPYISRFVMMFGIQQSGGMLRLICTPVVVLHNPYNVTMVLRRSNSSDEAAARLSFRYWSSWIFDFSTASVPAWSRSLLDLVKASDASWTGWSALGDDQIRLLARCIVDEIRFRTQLAVRTPADRQINKSVNLAEERRFRGTTAGTTVHVPTPFLGLSQFVNRFLDVTETLPFSGRATNLSQARAGCLQAAIARAEAEGAQVSNRASGAPALTSASIGPNVGDGQQSWASNPSAIESWDPGTRTSLTAKAATNQSHAALFAPGAVLQQDILAAIGSHLSARSDTFVIRAYGDVRSPNGESRGRAWIEAVVQRTPDYCAAADAPSADPTTLLAVNKQLGRRFRIVSARWLRADEI